LAERIGEERYAVWFGAGVRIGFEDSTLGVAVSDPFMLERLRKGFRRDLESALHHVVGKSAQVEYRLDATLQRKTPESPRATQPPHASRVESNGADGAKDAGSPKSSQASPRRQLARLDEFVVGYSNRVAFSAAQTVLERLGHVSPLFISGPTGTGKTHLLEGLAHAYRQVRGVSRVVLLSSEQFTTFFLAALRGSGLPNFRRKYRDVEVLLIDDIQFFPGKRATIDELKYTVDALLRNGRQVVLSADRGLSELSELGPDLLARISGGLVCPVEPPDVEMRHQIVRRLVARRGLRVPDSVQSMIAQRIAGDVRRLIGVLNRLEAVSHATSQPISMTLAESALGDILRMAERVVKLPDVEDAVCGLFGIEARGLHSNGRSKSVVQPRMLAMWLARKYTRAPFSEIGEYFGHRSHSTVISAHKKVEDWLADGARIQLGHIDCDVRDVVRRVEDRLRTG